MKRIRNTRGSTLTTAIIVLLLVLTLTGGIYVLASIYYHDSEGNHYERQAYLFAKSECKVFSQYLTNEGDKSPYYPSSDHNSAKTAMTTDIKLSRNTASNSSVVSGIKSNTVTYRWYGNNTIKYKVTVNYKGETSTVTLSCVKSDSSSSKKWIYSYE